MKGDDTMTKVFANPLLEKQRKFVEKKKEFNEKYSNSNVLEQSLVYVNGKIIENIKIRNDKGEKIEEYYKWEFIYALIYSGLYSKDYIGLEIHLPKGNKNSLPIKIDGCIFDSKEWINYYFKWIKNKDYDAVEWLWQHIIGIIEFKNEDGKDIKTVFTSQVKPYMKVSEADYCIGFYYDTGRLYIFKKENGKILRYHESKNRKGKKSGINDLSLEKMDSYLFIPSFEDLQKKINITQEIDVSKRTINDLIPITSFQDKELNNALLEILRIMDHKSLVNQMGYELLIETLALKISEEKYNKEWLDKGVKKYLKFYITDDEENYTDLNSGVLDEFIGRMKTLFDYAASKYPVLFRNGIRWDSENHMRVMVSIVKNLQEYSFINAKKSDLNQMVFYQFADTFVKEKKAQYVTPLNIVNFIVDIVNPRDDDTICDPTVGIADFLSASYSRNGSRLDSGNLYGVDIDEQMIMLSELNMLLSGVESDPVLKAKPGFGSLLYKFNTRNELVALNPKLHANGNWDNWKDGTQLKKFKVVLTNPPFGENRKFQPKNKHEREVASLYETWSIARVGDWIDLGILFLENAYRILDKNGRMGIVVSNSIASIDRWTAAREWLLSKMRIVALFDLPDGVFAETGVNTTIIIAYKPENEEELKKLQDENYEIFVRDIKNVGYEIRTTKGIKHYKEIYKINEEDFEIEVNEYGEPVLDEDFSTIIKDFKEWAKGQEEKLKKLFLGEI